MAGTCRGPGFSAPSPYSSALDAIQEALQLLESVRPETQAQDQLLDDKAQALLWLYICTLEAKMQEASVALHRTGYRACSPQGHGKLVPALFFIVISPSRVSSGIGEPRPLITWRNLKSMT